MAENNLIITIAIVLAATLFFSGTLTGEATRRSDFAQTPYEINQKSFAPCTEHRFGEILPGQVSVIKEVGIDCKEKIVEYCSSYGNTRQPFKTVYISYGVSDVVCSERTPDSSMKAPTVYGGGF
ncbi:MAG: hypothetical protein Q8R00_04310 [Candidatus Nanoarchaeia archaeon]|nr:hypothetical protein [Candidatus Nanoarchaeia archaeon]